MSAWLSVSERREMRLRSPLLIAHSGGATDCTVVLEFNNQCAAFVSPSDARFGGSTFARAASVDAASKMAVDACLKQGSDGCKVIYSGCTEPEFENF